MASFIADKIVMDGLTYDDVLLIPAYSEVLPRTVSLTTKFSRNIELKAPRPDDTNTIDNPRNIVPQESVQKVGKRFPITLAPYSITVLVIE